MNLLERLHMRQRCWRYRFKSEVPSIRYVRKCKELRGNTLIDVGANMGLYSIYMSRAAGNKGRVIAFEAQPELGSHLEGVKKNFHLDNLQIENVALSSQSGTLTLHRNKVGDGSASLNFFDGTENLEAIDVPVSTLDERLEGKDIGDVSFIKCDVEGHELSVFQGGERLLKQHMPTLLFECHQSEADDGEIFRYLIDLGYDGYFYHVSQRDHASILRRGQGEYIHYSKYAEYEYCRPTVFHRNYIFVPKGSRPEL